LGARSVGANLALRPAKDGFTDQTAGIVGGEHVLDIDLGDIDARPVRGEMVPSGLAPLSEIVESGFGLRLALDTLSRRFGKWRKSEQAG
jgi:hypothetical protein